MDPIDKLLAIEEIKQLKAQYFWTVDGKDWEGVAQLFTDDAVFDMTAEMALYAARGTPTPQQTVVVGGPAIAAFIEAAVRDPITVHHGSMPVIDIVDSDHATGRWLLFDFLAFGDREVRAYGWYEEEYRRVDGRWRISRLDLRRYRMDFSEPGPPGSVSLPA